MPPTPSAVTTPSPEPTAEPAPAGWPTPTVPMTKDGLGAQVRAATVRVLDCRSLTPDKVHATAGTAATFTLRNTAPDPLVVFAIDDRGQPQRRFDVQPGTTLTEQTFVTNPWVVTTATYQCVTVFYPPGEVTIG